MKKIIDRILDKFGYIQKSELDDKQELIEYHAVCDYLEGLDEDSLAFMLAEKLNIDVDDEIDEEYEKKIFKDLKGVDGLVQYLRDAAARDKNRYFAAGSAQEQLIIRGSFARTMYLKAKISTALNRE